VADQTEIGAESEYPSRTSACFALVIFLVAGLLSYIDRQILSLLVEPIRHDLGISDTQFSMLQGFAFAVFFVCAGLPFGWLVDRSNRRNIIVIGIVIWSSMTILSGFTTNFIELAITRMGLGIGEAALVPAAYSLLADYFPPRLHGRAISIFFTATYAGVGLGYVVGGLIIRAFKDVALVWLPLIGTLALWKAAFICVGVPSLLVAIPMMFVREVPRIDGAARLKQGGSGSTFTMFQYLRMNAVTVSCVIGGYVFAAFMYYAWQTWIPTYLVREFGIDRGTAGLLGGTIIAVTGILGSVLGGMLGDRWTAAGSQGGKFRLLLPLWYAAIPAMIALLLFHNLYVACAAVGVFFFFMAMAVGSVGATLQDMVPSHLRGQIVVLNYLMTGLFAGGLAPLTVALVTDRVFHDDNAVGLSLGLVPIPAIILGLFVTYAGMARYDRTRAKFRGADTRAPQVSSTAVSINPAAEVADPARI
jgi:MFS family permease